MFRGCFAGDARFASRSFVFLTGWSRGRRLLTCSVFGVRDGACAERVQELWRIWQVAASAGTICSVFVTARTEAWRQLVGEVADALRAAGLEPADLRDLLDAGRGAVAPLVVADRISEAGRDVLREAGWGWLDRRGHLRLWAPGLRIETPLGGADRRPSTRSTNPWTTVGLEIALAALVDPDEPITARRVAPVIGRSVGATHETIGRFAEVGLIGKRTNLPLLPDLFWETSAHWPDDGWIGLPVGLAELAERVGADELVRVDERAATLGGARIAAAGELPPRLYVRSGGGLRRARALADRDAPTRCWVRPSPVEWLPLNPEHPADDEHPWSVAHPMVCALRLAADPARGREIVEAWGILPSEDDDWGEEAR
jgi:hypothetical protein